MVGIGSLSPAPLPAAANSDMRLLRGRGRHLIGSGKRFGSSGSWLVCSSRGRRARTRSRVRRKEGFVIGSGWGSRRFGSIGLAEGGVRSAARRTLRGRAGRKNRRLVLDFQMSDFLLDLRLEFIRGALKFVQVLPNLACDFRQLLGPKDDESQEEQEDRLGKTHAVHHTAGLGKRQ